MKRHPLLLLAALSASAYGQLSNQPPPLIVGKAHLLNSLNSLTLQVGDLFYLRSSDHLQQGDCIIPSHTTITGRVESLSSSPTRPYDTILALRFFAIPCSGSNSKWMTPLLVSIKAPDASMSVDFNAGAPQTPALSGIFPRGLPAWLNDNGSRALTELNRLGEAHTMEKPMRIGEIRGYRDIGLTLPGKEGLDAKLSAQHKIVLYRNTEFAFTYAPKPADAPSVDVTPTAPPPVPTDLPGMDATPAILDPLPPPTAVEMEDACASLNCRQLAAVAETGTARALWSLPLTQLGYQPRARQWFSGLDHSASAHFLGEDQILLTFSRHVLLHRSSDPDAWTSNPRGVRAVLISRADGHVLRVQDWIVADDIGPFVWSLGNGRVVAHVGHDLVKLGPGLAIQQRFRLAGPLLFLSASPTRNLLLVATVHEKHTQKQHAQIVATVGPDLPIDEEYDLTGLNAAFQVTGAKRVTVPPLPPALLQHSMVTSRPLSATQWLVEESTWEGQSRGFARFRSACQLQIRSFPGDLLFIQGCSPTEANTTWYRVLNAQGATLFKGSGPDRDFVQQTESSDDGRLFAIASSHFNRSVDRNTQLRIGDFTDLSVTIYDTATGKQLFAAHPREGSAQEDTFCVSPSNSALAVLTSNSLQVFPLPAPKK